MKTAGPLGALALASLLLAAGAAAQPTSVSTSVSEASARARIESRGFRDIGVLSETSAGVWNGTASKAGKYYGVTVDRRGFVIAE
jgi:hypothetical protein